MLEQLDQSIFHASLQYMRVAALIESGAVRARLEAEQVKVPQASSFTITSMLPAPFARLAPPRALVSLLGAARGHCGAARRFVAGTGAAPKKSGASKARAAVRGRGHRPLQPYPEGVAIP